MRRNNENTPPPDPFPERREIIIIDDEPVVLQLTVLALEGLWKPSPFDDPIAALMHAADAEPTCIVVDLKLPGIEGLDLVAAFCAMKRHAVILSSAYVNVSTAVEAMRLGVDNVLTKPMRHETLVDAIKESLAALDALPKQDLLTFTNRERQVAEFLVAGLRTKEIAIEVGVSPRTVEFFRASLLRKTQSKSVGGLFAALVKLGFYGSDGSVDGH